MSSPKEEKNKRKGFLTSVVIHTLLLALLIIPMLTYPDPPPGQEGILVNLGADFGQGEENAPEPSSDTDTPVEEVESEPVEVEDDPTPPVEETKPEKKPEKQPEKEVVKTEDPNAIALKKKKEEEAAKKAEEDARKKAEEEARRKAEEERKRQEEYEKTKNKFSGLYGGKDGEGKGDTGQAGNQGDKDGDPDASKLEGVSTGAGQVGGGLSDRGVLASPRVTDNSQKTGVVVLKVCVDSNGGVVSAEYTQAGSTTTDSGLRNLAIANAKRWKFSKSSLDKQCGTIRYEFKVQ